MEIAIIILLGILIIISIVNIAYTIKGKNKTNENVVGCVNLTDKDKADIINAFGNNINIISLALKDSATSSSKVVDENLKNMSEKIKDNRELTEKKFDSIERKLTENLESIRKTLEVNINKMQESNEKKLDEIRNTVDEKLTKTLNERFAESFKVLTGELEKVSKTIGEMQNISATVGNLSKVLSNVKTTGIFGEIQLGAIIDQILTPGQYEKNVVTAKNSREPVEFVVKLPGGDDGEVLLPIDSKFPYNVYTEMQTAYEQNKFEECEAKRKQLVSTIRSMAKDIKEKYICPPRTTNFAVMFLPVEGLYAEVVKNGLVEELQSKYSVTIAGPTTMAALLNSLHMGFQTLAIQKKSNEVWRILGSVKNEFSKFGEIMEKVQDKLTGASKELDKLIGVRTRAIDRSLRNVESIPVSLVEETIDGETSEE